MTEFVEVKTAELEGAALDWAVAMACGCRVDPDQDGAWNTVISPKGVFTSISVRGHAEGFGFRPSVDWSQGGPLLGEYQMEFRLISDTHLKAVIPTAFAFTPVPGGVGETHLIAGCRAIVLHKLGPAVSVPKEVMP